MLHCFPLSSRATVITSLAAAIMAAAIVQGKAGQTPATPASDRVPMGPAVKLTLEFSGQPADGFTLLGRDARQQLVVTAWDAAGHTRDLTRSVHYTTEPTGIVGIDATGVVTPLADGKAKITAAADGGLSAATTATAAHMATDVSVNFPNQIVPIFTKLGCNSGGCHGKASGQNGFRLSLLGFEPAEDYEHLVMEGHGRRLFPAAPERSLLLLKATGTVPHGGGQRMDVDSPSYRLMRRWIEQGLPFGKPDDPKVASIEVVPPARTLPPSGQQQIICLAHYTDGSVEDVTANAKFEPNDTEMAEVSPSGLVTARDLPGTVAVMARYQGQVAVFRASLPLGAPVADLPAAKNVVDEAVFKQLTTLGIPPSKVCDDATFIRRVTVDIAGRLPTVEESNAFVADKDPAKRAKLIDTLLDSDGYADYFATKWSAILRNKRVMDAYEHGNFLFRDWIRQSLFDNKPYDQFVREIITASGEASENPPVVWYRAVKEPNQQMEDTAQLFLGLRIQCARCHHHPFEKWSQQDYYGFEAFFSRVRRKPGLEPMEERIYHERGEPSAENIRSHQQMKPAGLGAKPLALSVEQDPRQALVDWMVESKNPFFARALANRYWKHFFGRGIVEPEDDMRATNPASNPELLAALADSFTQSKYDLKQLIRTICNSQVYQLSSEPNQFNAGDRQSFSRYYPRRLTAEVLLDAIDSVTAVDSKFNGMPNGTRAVQLPDSGFNSYFLTVFGRPEGASSCECERTGDATLTQSLHLLNSVDVQNKLSAGAGRAAALAADQKHSQAQKIDQLYLEFFSRPPTSDEAQYAQAYIARTKNDRAAYEDIIWALLNTKEFLFNH